MKKLALRRRRPLPVMMAELMMASWETIARRSLMIVQGTCRRGISAMVMEKAAALQQSAIAVMSGRGKKATLAPWHRTRYSKRAAAAPED